jgi:hypothetical protein
MAELELLLLLLLLQLQRRMISLSSRRHANAIRPYLQSTLNERVFSTSSAHEQEQEQEQEEDPRSNERF